MHSPLERLEILPSPSAEEGAKVFRRNRKRGRS